MPNKPVTEQRLLAENDGLRARLAQAERSLREMRSGEVDALVVSDAGGAQLFSLRDANQSFQALIENMSEGALTLTPAGLILYANRRFADMLGTSLEKVIGSDIHTWFPGERREALQALLQKDAADNRREEAALAGAGGTRVPVYLSVSRLVLNGSESVCVVVTDLTGQKRDEAILASATLSRAILEQSAEAIVICDGTGRILRASKTAHKLSVKSLLGERFAQAFALRQSDGGALPSISAIDTSDRESIEATLEIDGQRVDLLVGVGHLKDKRDELLGSVVTFWDVTQRKQREQELLATKTQLQETLNAIPDLLFEMGLDGRYYAYHSPRTDLLAAPPEDMLGKTVAEVLPAEAAEIVLAALREANATGRSSGEVIELALPQGRLWFELSISRMAVAVGQQARFICLSRDITERKQAENRIARLTRVLAMLSGINMLIVRMRDREELFREACKVAVDAGGFRMALVAMVDRESMKAEMVASAGKDEPLQAAIKALLHSRATAPNTMIAQALAGKVPVISNDSRSDPRVLLGKRYAESGVRSIALFPLIVSNEAVGVLALYAGEPEFFHDQEVKQLTELAGDVAFALDHLEKRERLDYLAYYDELTGLANRALFLERLAQHMRAATVGGHGLALFLLDLARFKNINDSLGRPAGDALLRQVADWLSQSTGDATLVARLGADFFAVVLPEVKPEEDMTQFLEERMEAFVEHPFRLDGAVLRLAIKVGAALYPEDGADADALFRNAEAALKRAKARGERYLFYTQAMTDRMAGALTLENQLRQALDESQFVLHYQPKISLASGRVTGVEALIRWNDPRTGLVPPGKFIPVLEETGLILEVGRWSLRQALADYLRWRAAGLLVVRVAVNLSPLQLRHRDFIADIEKLVGIDASAAAGLELEITESLVMEDVKHSISSLRALRSLGVTIAIDDFGTGFSSLSYLAKLPVDTLKIDRSFITDMTASPEGLSLVSTIINLAHSLKLNVVAEGVETEEQSQLLRLLRCDEMQGFLFSKPVPREVFEAKFLTSLG